MTFQALLNCLFSVILVLIGCDRVKGIVSISQVNEPRELTVESLIESMMEKNKKNVEEAHKKGETSTVGLVDGKNGFANVILDEANEKETMSLYSDRKNQSTGAAALDAIRILLIRVSDVTSGHSFGDTMEAVTKFYQDKPLLKDRPVIWVLAVPLYKQLQEAKPPDKRDTQNDTVPVPIKTKQKERHA